MFLLKNKWGERVQWRNESRPVGKRISSIYKWCMFLVFLRDVRRCDIDFILITLKLKMGPR